MMTNRKAALTAGAVLGLLAIAPMQAQAQTAGLGTTNAGATNQLATNIAAVVSSKSPVQLRTQGMAGAAQYIPRINAGQLAFGVANLVETRFSISGEAWMVGKPNPNIKIVASLFPFKAGLVVKADGPIKTVADLKGRRIPSGFSGNPLGDRVFDAVLATAGLKRSDVQQIPIPTFPRMFDTFEQQQIDTSIAAFGSGRLMQMESVLKGIRYLSMPNTPEALAQFQKLMPGSTFTRVTKDMPASTGVAGEAWIFQYEYLLFAGAHVPDATVAAVAKALFENEKDLKATGALWNEYDPKLLAKDIGAEFHPGARKFYESVGIWKR